MSEETDHEFLSAYLDGELTADERRHVEQLLAESAEYRQVYEELRALRASLAALPREHLDEDLGPTVIRLAEQTMLGKRSARGAEGAVGKQGESAASSAGEVATAGSITAAESQGRRWRAIVYPLLAAAAAVAMLLNEPKDKEKPGRPIARAPVKEPAFATLSAPADELREQEEMATDNGAEDRDANASDAFNSHRDDGGMLGGGMHVKKRQAGETAEPRGDRAQEAGIAGEMKRLSKPSRGPVPLGLPAQTTAEIEKAAAGSPPPTLVVACQLAPAAVRDKAFDALLARNHLAASEASDFDAPKDAAERLDRGARKPLKPAPAADATELAPAEASRKKEPSDDNVAGKAEVPTWSRTVVVELDARQLAALLADLEAHSDQFVSVELPGRSASKGGTLAPAPSAGPASAAPGDEPTIAESLPVDAATSNAKPAAPVAARDSDAARSNRYRAEMAADRGSPTLLRVEFRLSEANGN